MADRAKNLFAYVYEICGFSTGGEGVREGENYLWLLPKFLHCYLEDGKYVEFNITDEMAEQLRTKDPEWAKHIRIVDGVTKTEPNPKTY